MSAFLASNSFRKESQFTVAISQTRFTIGMRYLEKGVTSGSASI